MARLQSAAAVQNSAPLHSKVAASLAIFCAAWQNRTTVLYSTNRARMPALIGRRPDAAALRLAL
ncbi:hypothetical protein NKJ06_24600 [Mesorhizobium sp. M0293]|uniref:hypothetical protein n=1 Tax=Mesorhizobium sp. M0293 TaxID=2956930 RepID=UPI00333D01F1